MTVRKSLVGLRLAVLAALGLACGGETPPPETEARETDPGVGSGQIRRDERVVPVEAQIVRTQTVSEAVPLIGVLQPLHVVDIVAEVQGKVTRIAREMGDPVMRGDTLAVIDDRIPLSQYRQAQAQVLSAEANLEIARTNLESDRELARNGDISRLALDNAKLAVKAAEAERLGALAQLSATEKHYADTRVTSPIAGQVARRYVDVGAMAMPGTPLYRVVDLSVLRAEAGVPQAQVSRVRVGSRARVVLTGLAGRTFEGEVRHIGPQADAASGAFPVEVHVANTPGNLLRAGMTVRAEILLTDQQQRLAVPEYAVMTRNGDHHAYRITGGTARLTPVTVAEVLGDQAVIEQGLAEGDTIVVVGMKNLGVATPVSIETLF